MHGEQNKKKNTVIIYTIPFTFTFFPIHHQPTVTEFNATQSAAKATWHGVSAFRRDVTFAPPGIVSATDSVFQ